MTNPTRTSSERGAMPAVRRIAEWIDARLSLSKVIEKHATEYYAPKSFNFWYYFGSLALVVDRTRPIPDRVRYPDG